MAGHDIVLEDDERRNPTVVAISFRDLWKPGNFGRRRWRFFRAHFQFLMANERLGAAYDHYLICCGPLDLVSRALKPQEAIAAMAAKQIPSRPFDRGLNCPPRTSGVSLQRLLIRGPAPPRLPITLIVELRVSDSFQDPRCSTMSGCRAT